MELHREEIEAAGLQVLAIGIGEPKHAERYCGKLAPGIDCFTNKHTDMYHRYGLQQSSWQQFLSAGIFRAAVRVLRAGFRQGKATGDVKMLPGTFVVDKNGVIQFVHYSDHAGDQPEIAKITAVAQNLAT
ncbi:MAG: hypothetical protein CL608_14275 [Anaerolineaceae bacterium]|nr:hypothetical protein [Anaerolineaceae bacterium]